MTNIHRYLIAGAVAAFALSPAYAGGGSSGGHGSSSGGWTSSGSAWGSTSGGHGSTSSGSSSSGGSTSGGSTSGGATPVPEPSDAVLLLMGAAGVVVGRRLHARKRRG